MSICGSIRLSLDMHGNTLVNMDGIVHARAVMEMMTKLRGFAVVARLPFIILQYSDRPRCRVILVCGNGNDTTPRNIFLRVFRRRGQGSERPPETF